MNLMTYECVKRSRLLALLLTVLAFAGCTKEEIPTSVTDIDGNVYPVAKIGSKVWMTENLRTAHYKNGSPIFTGLDSASWRTAPVGAYAIYDDDAANNITYGKLYNWLAVSNMLAPEGWHVATEAEWADLISYLGGTSVAGGKMKSTSSLWDAPNTGANNSSGFNALPGGAKPITAEYVSLGNTCYFWASTEQNSTDGEYFSLSSNAEQTSTSSADKNVGFSVRCVKD